MSGDVEPGLPETEVLLLAASSTPRQLAGMGDTYSSRMSDLGRLQKLVEETIDRFDEPGQTTSTLLRKCIRIATMRNDFINLLWLQQEADESNVPNFNQHRLGLLAHFDKEDADRLNTESTRAYIQRRMIPNEKDKVYPASIEGLEEHISHLQQQADVLVAPEGLHPIDAYHRSAEIAQAKTMVLSAISSSRVILGRIRAALYEFLVTTEQQLDYGRVNAEIFERTRTFVDEQLAAIAPDALDKFQSAYRRINEGDPESLSQAHTSCRRILKSVADAIYPPVATPVIGADGKPHSLTDDKYKNRMQQFMSEAIGTHGSVEVIEATIQDLVARLDALDALASKGVHATVTASEVDLCHSNVSHGRGHTPPSRGSIRST